MFAVIAFAFVGGVLTILSPCILPIVPLIAGTAAVSGRRQLGGLVLGFGATFVAATVLLASTLAAVGVTTGALRIGSAVALGLVGAAIAIPALGSRFEAWSAPLVRFGASAIGGANDRAFAGSVALGAAIGVIWAPCVGPIMAAVIAVAVTSGPSAETLAIAVAYVAGAAVPLAIVGRAGQRARRALGGAQGRQRAVRAFGALTLAGALLILTGLDVPLQTTVAGVLPAGWTSALFAIEQQPAQNHLEALRSQESAMPADGTAASAPNPTAAGQRPLPSPLAADLPARVALEDLGPAPELRGISAWINADPLTLASLRGQVVLVHFWTFGCINCKNVQPYVKAWFDRYADAGFTVLSVHTPELSFERDVDNVRQAVADADVRYAVAIDPDFATWNAYGNSYWPAFYFVDRQGHVRHVHFGEGDYGGSEQVIRQLLAEAG